MSLASAAASAVREAGRGLGVAIGEAARIGIEAAIQLALAEVAAAELRAGVGMGRLRASDQGTESEDRGEGEQLFHSASPWKDLEYGGASFQYTERSAQASFTFLLRSVLGPRLRDVAVPAQGEPQRP